MKLTEYGFKKSGKELKYFKILLLILNCYIDTEKKKFDGYSILGGDFYANPGFRLNHGTLLIEEPWTKQ